MVRKREDVNFERDLIDQGYELGYEASNDVLLEVLCSIVRLTSVRKQSVMVMPGKYVGREKGRHYVYVKDRS